MKINKISIIKTVKVAIVTSFLLVSVSHAASVKMDGPDKPHMSTLQVKSAVKKKHKGRIIFIERKPTAGHPNCHIVKMVTTTGEFRYIRYAC